MKMAWVNLQPKVHELAHRTAAMEGYLLLDWIVRVLDAACRGEMKFPSIGAPDRVNRRVIPKALKKRCELVAGREGLPVAAFVESAILKNCWSREHLDAVSAAL